MIHSKGQWAVTDYGLELLSKRPTRAERHREWLEQISAHWTSLSAPSKRRPIGDDSFKIPASELLDELVERRSGLRFYRVPIVVAEEPWVNFDCFDAFEDCFYAAMPVHCCPPLPVPQTFEEFIRMHF